MEYVRRRDFDATPEPAPGDLPEAAAGNSFVIQKHRATALHYDVRLERDGALPSWAVPKGLPLAKGDKRLAVRTEDHPLEYGSFEGTIPEGHYGAGEVRIFDDGWYEPIEWTDAKVSFRLHGRRYPGLEFHFVKTRQNWLAFLASAQEASLISAPPRYQPMLAEGGWESVRRSGVVVRAEDRRDPLPRRAHDGRDHAAHPHGTGGDRPVPRAPHDPRARRPGERGDRRRDRGLRRGRAELLRDPAAADEPHGRTGDQTHREADPRGARGLRPALAGRQRDDIAEARGTPRTPRADRGDRPPTPGGDPRRGRGNRPRRDGGLARARRA